MSITPVHIEKMELPDTAYNMWVRGELDDFVHAPRGSKVEVIGGKVVVSPPPEFEHNNITIDVHDTFTHARRTRSDFSWRSHHGSGLSLVGAGDGFVPDLMILDEEVFQEARRARVKSLVPDQVELVAEITSKGHANDDRHTARGARKKNKWIGYAAAEIPYYLLIDRAPKIARATLYSIPDQGSAAYLHEESWVFGETIRLPDPFSLGIDTSEWRTW